MFILLENVSGVIPFKPVVPHPIIIAVHQPLTGFSAQALCWLLWVIPQDGSYRGVTSARQVRPSPA